MNISNQKNGSTSNAKSTDKKNDFKTTASRPTKSSDTQKGTSNSKKKF